MDVIQDRITDAQIRPDRICLFNATLSMFLLLRDRDFSHIVHHGGALLEVHQFGTEAFANHSKGPSERDLVDLHIEQIESQFAIAQQVSLPKQDFTDFSDFETGRHSWGE